jgi:N-acetylneuraminic acid mutarotase
MKKYWKVIHWGIFILLFNFDTQAQNYSWKANSSLPANSRWGAFSFSIGNYGYIGGGYMNGSLSDVWQYDPITDLWTQKADIPIAVRTASTFVLNNLGYVTGGITSANFMSTLYEYNPATNLWTTKAPFPGIARYGGIGFAIGNKGYFGIGNTGGALGPYLNDFYEYNPASNQWTQKATFPGTARYGGHGVATANLGYVGFGANENLNVLFNDWWEYNPVTNVWTNKANYPGVGRSYPASFFINSKIYLGTGQTLINVLDDMYSFDHVNNVWVPEQSFTGGSRWLVAAFSINNIGYFSTGALYGGSITFNDCWKFSPDSSVCITLKPNASEGKDAHVLSGLPNTNVEPHPELLAVAWTCGGSPCNDRALIQFDMSFIPANATIVSASLSLFANPNPVTIPAANYGANNSFYIRRITSFWDENLVTWNLQPSVTNQNEILIPQSTSSSQNYLNINVTPLVIDMLNDPANSYGFMLQLQNEIYYNGRDFVSSDNMDSAKWPSITYCYTVPTSIKQNNSNNLFVNVYPNAFSDHFLIEIASSKSQIANMEIMDVSGRVIIERNLNVLANTINKFNFNNQDLSSFVSGVYLIRINGETISYTNKMVKN